MPVSTVSFDCERVPFANERQLQRFVIANAAKLFRAEVVASTLPLGRPLHRVDVLAIDDNDRVFLIECKWDAIDSLTVDQLLGYKEKLLRDWRTLEKRVAQHRGRPLRPVSKSLVLAAIGYRCKGALRDRDASVQTLIYGYHPNTFGSLVESQVPGIVRVGIADECDYGLDAHPEVLKTAYAKARTEGLPPTVRQQFWAIDGRLRGLEGVQPKYRGKKAKDLASYRRDGRTFATASMEPDSIRWRCSVPHDPKNRHLVKLGRNSDPENVLQTLLDAYNAV